jgi:serine protease Do
MSDPLNAPALCAFRDELTRLARSVVPATAIITGQLRDFSESAGSGWLYDPSHLVTNFHVVDGLTEPIHVRMPGESQIKVQLVGTDPATDLAVLAVPSPVAPPLSIRLDEPALGELCFAFGSPLGQYPESMSMGIVSGLHRRIDWLGNHAIEDVIQTDAAINHGNSGGPLVDVEGKVIGVNSAGATDAQNINWAIPAITVADIVPELIMHGSIQRASLGLTVSAQVVEVGDRRGERVVVSAVKARTAGPFEAGDVLLRVNDKEIWRRGDLLRALRRELIGRRVEVDIWRKGSAKRLSCSPFELR